jgi:hypothetical protein
MSPSKRIFSRAMMLLEEGIQYPLLFVLSLSHQGGDYGFEDLLE